MAGGGIGATVNLSQLTIKDFDDIFYDTYTRPKPEYTDLFNVKVRPAIVDEPGRIDRWVISRSYPAGDYSGAYVDGEVQIDVLHPLNTPAITITVAGKTAIRLTQLTPLDLWDGQKLIEATTTVYDRLREEVDLIGERSY